MNRSRTTEDPGLWRLIYESEPSRRLTLEVFEGPGVRARTIEIIADGAIRIDGKAIMSAVVPRLRKSYEKRKRHTTPIVDALWRDIHAIAQEVAEASGVDVTEMRGRSKKTRIVEARKVASFLTERRLGLTHADVGKFFGRERSVISDFIADVVRQIGASRATDTAPLISSTS